MSPGTPASGLAGAQGSYGAMNPQQQFLNTPRDSSGRPITNTTGGASGISTLQSRPPAPLTGQAAAQNWLAGQRNTYLNSERGGAAVPTPSGYGTDDSWYRPVSPTNNIVQPPPLSPGQYMNAQGGVSQGATPFGTNSFGERLDASGNVWDPTTATTDIYGGKFIQPGETRWERNKNGRMIKVQYGKGGQKTEMGKGAAKRRRAEAAAGGNQYAGGGARPVQAVAGNMAPEASASAFVSFRA
jgi:hypothetical protein